MYFQEACFPGALEGKKRNWVGVERGRDKTCTFIISKDSEKKKKKEKAPLIVLRC